MGESTRRHGLDQPLSEAELARARLSVRLMQTSSGTEDDNVIPRLLSTRGWQAKQEISKTMTRDPDEEVVIESDKPARFRSGVFLEGDVTGESKGCASRKGKGYKSGQVQQEIQ